MIRMIGMIGLIAIIFALVWGRLFFGSKKNFEKGEDHLRNRNLVKAIAYFDRSIRWYTPFNPYVERSAARLWKIGNLAEDKGDLRLALTAYRTLRRGFYAVGSLYQAGPEWIEKSEKRMNLIVQREKNMSGGGGSPKEKEIGFPPTRTIDRPDIFWSLVLEIGLLGWIFSTIRLILFSLKGRSRRVGNSGYLLRIACLSFFFSIWIVGMLKA